MEYVMGNMKAEKAKVKIVRPSAKDIQERCMRINEALKRTPVGTPEYETLQKQLEHELVNLKKYKDAKFYIAPKDAAIIGGTAVCVIFFLALAREYPSAMKVGSMILKIMPFKGI